MAMESEKTAPQRMPRHSTAWNALCAHLATMRDLHIRDLFLADPDRGSRFCIEAAGWYLDYSKNRITFDTLELLVLLARENCLPARIEAMFNGDAVNVSEGRAALHVALRMPACFSLPVAGTDVIPIVQGVLAGMERFTDALRDGACLGATGRPIRNVVNIGIGGSSLGVGMACAALQHYSRRDMTFRFISNVDGTDFAEATRDLDPRETLFVVCSKTFHTMETLENAQSARAWCQAAIPLGRAWPAHFVAVTGNREAAAAFGVLPDRIFDVWDWVDGRYSLCSAMGLVLMAAIGARAFREMLAGFHDMDLHFRYAPLERNMPVLHGLISVWNNNFLGSRSVAVLPYDHYLRRFPSYIQQLMMESNGKSVTQCGAPANCHTGPVYWGASGTNGQHSFYQLLHQGSQIVPCDFIGFLEPLRPPRTHHDELMANLFAQAEALSFGRGQEGAEILRGASETDAHRHVEGNRPSNTLLARRLSPATLGALMALYEHSAFTQGVIWNIDSFDQWGVELGKVLASRIARELQAGEINAQAHDSSTRNLMSRLLAAKHEALQERRREGGGPAA
ncbi:MAG: glucose-6-phosphate isomerase [Achromobacter veterisilvae]